MDISGLKRFSRISVYMLSCILNGYNQFVGRWWYHFMRKIFKWGAILVGLGFAMMLLTRLPALGLEEASFCGRCHSMQVQVDTYMHSPHREVANCGDCHDPHGLVTGGAYAAYTGTRDLYRVVTNTIPREIRTTELSKRVLQDNCLRCHQDIMKEIADTSRDQGKHCFHCHQEIVHEK